MRLETQYTIKSNPNFIRYLRENSNWYKLLNRNPDMIKVFIEEVKEKYKMRPTDKIYHVLETIEVLQNVFSTIK